MANTWNASTCGYSDVNDYAGNGAFAGSVADDDTVIVPACAGTTWTDTLTVTKAITLQGAGCAVDASGYPTSCSTVIRDGVTTGSRILFDINAVAGSNKRSRVTGFEINWNGAGDPNPNGVVTLTGATGGTIRFDHNIIDRPQTFLIRTSNARGVIDHNTLLFDAVGTHTPLYIYDQGATLNGDMSWGTVATGGTALTWGSSDFLFVEDNKIYHDSGDGACTDGNSGSRAVFRFNSVSGCSFQNHGTESFGRPRSGRAMEVYGNLYAGTADEILGVRGGSALVWQNVGVASTDAAVKMVCDRTSDQFYAWGTADGTNKWDINDPGSPFDGGEKTASSGTGLTVTVTGAGWSSNQWRGYSIKKTTSCPTPNCSSMILSNTDDTITFNTGAGFAGTTNLSFITGEKFVINKVTRAQDQPGVGGGTTLLEIPNCNITSVGTLATVSCTHGLTDLDYVDVYYNTDGLGILSPYYGIFQAHVTSSSTFEYTCPTICGGSISAYITKVIVPNDQSYFPIYTWLNTNGTSNIVASVSDSATGIVVENQSFYNYGGTLQSNNTTPFNGTASTNNGVGVGTKANMPTSCTGLSLYVATDEGSWRTAIPSTGQTFQSVAYQCSGGTFAPYYTPYTYPHPLAGGEVPVAPMRGRSMQFFF